MTDSERREVLLILINRAMRGVLLPDELVLLRRLVDAEVAAGDEARRQAEIANDVTAASKRLLGRRVDTLRTRAEQAEAAIARVRGLHRKATHGDDCVYCVRGNNEVYDVTWPCDTLAALDGPQTPDKPPPMDPIHILGILAQRRAAGYAAQADA